MNDPPTITAINSQTVLENGSAGPISIRVGDVDSSVNGLTMSATSSNPNLIPAGNVSFGGFGANRTVTIRPTRSRTGSADITVRVSDSGGRSATTSFRVTVTRR